jgi:hypothetical protein
MTMLQVSDKNIAALDQIRVLRGISTRSKALEIILSEVLDANLEALEPSDLKRINKRIKKADLETKTSLEEVEKMLGIN